MTEMRHKHSQDISQLNNQLDQVKKKAVQAEKMKSRYEAELADISMELKSMSGNKLEAEYMRNRLKRQERDLNANQKKAGATRGESTSILVKSSVNGVNGHESRAVVGSKVNWSSIGAIGSAALGDNGAVEETVTNGSVGTLTSKA